MNGNCLAFSGRVQRVTECDEIEVVGVAGAGRRATIVASGDLEAADEPLPDLQADAVIHRQEHIGRILEAGKQFAEVIEREAVFEERPIPLDRDKSADARLVSCVVELLVEIRQPGFRVERHVLANP